MYFVHLWDGCPWKDTLLILSRLLIGSVCKSRHDDPGVGDGRMLYKPPGDWSQEKFEGAKPNLIGPPVSHEGLHAKDLPKGLLFLCFREPKLCAICSVLQSNNATENGR